MGICRLFRHINIQYTELEKSHRISVLLFSNETTYLCTNCMTRKDAKLYFGVIYQIIKHQNTVLQVIVVKNSFYMNYFNL